MSQMSWSNPTGRCPVELRMLQTFFCKCNCLGPNVQPHRTLPPVELRMLYWLQSLNSSTGHCRPLSFGFVIASICLDRSFTKLSPLTFASILFCKCNCLGPNVQPHRTLPPVELRMLCWLQSLNSSTGHCRPLSFGFVIASICLDRFFTKPSPLTFASILFCKCNCLGPTSNPTGRCPRLSFGCFIGFRVWILPPDIAARWASDSSLRPYA